MFFFAPFCTFGRKQKSPKVIDLQGFSIFCFSYQWCHQEENEYYISIDSQPFILFQNWNPTRFSTRLFFIVLLAISRVAFAKLRKSVGIACVLFDFSLLFCGQNNNRMFLFCRQNRNGMFLFYKQNNSSVSSVTVTRVTGLK